MIDFKFRNGTAPYLSADNLNQLIDGINNNEIMANQNAEDIQTIAEQSIPEDVVERVVDDYVEEHQAGLEPKARKMTKSQFDALSEEQKKGTIHVTDEFLQNDLINDNVTSGSKTWSSQKIVAYASSLTSEGKTGNITISANNNSFLTVDVTKTDYIPFIITNVFCNNMDFIFQGSQIVGNTVKLLIKNTSTSSKTFTVNFDVIYKKI